jgi:hypothetical protein
MPGLGVASAVLAGVLVAITFAAGLTHFDPSPQQLADRAPAVLEIKTGLVHARHRPATHRLSSDRVRASARPRAAAVTARRPTSRGIAVEPQTSSPPPPPAAAPPLPAPADPLAPRSPPASVGAGVDATTSRVAATVRAVTHDLGDRVKPLSPEVGGVVSSAGAVVGAVVQGTGHLLGRVLTGLAGGPR